MIKMSGRANPGCLYTISVKIKNKRVAAGEGLHPLLVEGALFLGYIPLPGPAVVRRRDGGASVFNLASAVQTGPPGPPRSLSPGAPRSLVPESATVPPPSPTAPWSLSPGTRLRQRRSGAFIQVAAGHGSGLRRGQPRPTPRPPAHRRRRRRRRSRRVRCVAPADSVGAEGAARIAAH